MKKVLFLISILIIMYSCTDNNSNLTPLEQLPEATQTGENTFACLINGEPFVVNNTSQQVAIYQGGILQIGGGIDNSETDISISIILENLLDINISYNLTNYPIHTAKFRKREENLNCYSEFEDIYEGNIIFT